MANPPSTTGNLARKARKGDQASFAALYVNLSPAIYAYASLRLRERWISPEDTVGEVWRRVSERLSDYDAQRPFRAWVFGFAQRVMREIQRKLARSSSLASGGANQSSGSPLDRVPASITSASRRAAQNEELRRFIAWARSSLSDYERDVLILRGLQGRTAAEAAKVLDRTEHAVDVCWLRVREKIARWRLPRDFLAADVQRPSTK